MRENDKDSLTLRVSDPIESSLVHDGDVKSIDRISSPTLRHFARFYVHHGACTGICCFSVFSLSILWLSLLLSHDSQPTWSTPYNISDVYSPDSVLTFVHISDLHILEEKQDSVERVLDFVENVAVHLDPAFVLITGDMIHGYEVESSFTPNYEAQWNWYSRVRQALSVNNLTAIDMLGNHDTIGLIGLDSNPFFSEKRARRWYDVCPSNVMDLETLHIVALDQTLEYGAINKLNYAGIPRRGVHDTLRHAIDKRDSEPLHSNVLVASHFCDLSLAKMFERDESSHLVTNKSALQTSIDIDKSLLNSGSNYDNLLNKLGPDMYFCGHYHSPNMYARLGSSRYVEAEIAAFKNHCTFRITAVDSGRMTFIDYGYDYHDNNASDHDFPYGIITNPKDASLSTPNDAHGAMGTIRVMAFDPNGIDNINVHIDGQLLVSPVSPHMYTLAWNASDYASGFHDISVNIVSVTGNKRSLSHKFSLDGHVSPLPRGMLNVVQTYLNMPSVVLIVFGSIFACWITPLVLSLAYSRVSLVKMNDHIHDNIMFVDDDHKIASCRSSALCRTVGYIYVKLYGPIAEHQSSPTIFDCARVPSSLSKPFIWLLSWVIVSVWRYSQLPKWQKKFLLIFGLMMCVAPSYIGRDVTNGPMTLVFPWGWALLLSPLQLLPLPDAFIYSIGTLSLVIITLCDIVSYSSHTNTALAWCKSKYAPSATPDMSFVSRSRPVTVPRALNLLALKSPMPTVYSVWLRLIVALFWMYQLNVYIHYAFGTVGMMISPCGIALTLTFLVILTVCYRIEYVKVSRWYLSNDNVNSVHNNVNTWTVTHEYA